MIRRLLLPLLLLTVGSLSYGAQQTINVGAAPNDGTGDLGRTAFQKVNGNFVELYLQRRFNIMDYGAVCDGVTNDSAAWNSAITAAKAAANISGTPTTTKVIGCSGQSLVTSTINFSGIISPVPTAFTVDMAGGCILGETNGTPVIDAMGSAYIRWVHLCIKGMSTLTPNVGIQWGRLATGVPADQFYWDHPVVEGFFTFAAAYNLASEDNTFIAPRFTNATTSGTTYGLVMDGYAFWATAPNNKITSAFQTIPSSVTAYSFIGETVIGGNIVSNNTTSAGGAIWTGDTAQHHYHGTYVNSDGSYDVVLYCGTAGSGGVNKNLSFDVHTEGTSVTNTFLLTGAQVGACTLTNFSYIDNQNFATTSVFKIDGTSAVTSAIFNNADIKIDTFHSAISIFDTAANYSMSGSVFVLSSSNWNTPTGTTGFSGTLCYATRCDSYSNPTGTQNFGIGLNALGLPVTGNFNTALGISALAGAGTAGNNVAVGYNSLTGVTSGATNAALGSTAGQFISTGASNTALGYAAMTGVTGTRTTGNSNTAVGATALTAAQGTAANNTAVGSAACATVTTGTNNLCLGKGADVAGATDSNTIHINTGGGDIISATGTGTPSTSTTTVAGALNVTGLLAPLATVGVKGTVGADQPAAGSVGEVYSIHCIVGTAAQAATAVTITNATPAVVTWTSHTFVSVGAASYTCPINFTGTPPTGIAVATNYYIIGSSVSGDTFQIADTAAHALAATNAIATSGADGGTTAYIGNLGASTTAFAGAGINLVAGDWDCTAVGEFQELTSLTTTRFASGINASVLLTNIGEYTDVRTVTGSIGAVNYYQPTPVVRKNLSATTNELLVVSSTFSAGTQNEGGFLRCRRMR